MAAIGRTRGSLRTVSGGAHFLHLGSSGLAETAFATVCAMTIQGEIVRLDPEAARSQVPHVTRAAENVINATAGVALKMMMVAHVRQFVARALPG